MQSRPALHILFTDDHSSGIGISDVYCSQLSGNLNGALLRQGETCHR